MKVANKQWESAIVFLVTANWIKGEILEAKGKKSESIENYEVEFKFKYIATFGLF